MDYNKTINLPKTDFPMRAGLPKREPEMLKRWQEQDVYNEMLKKNEGHRAGKARLQRPVRPDRLAGRQALRSENPGQPRPVLQVRPLLV